MLYALEHDRLDDGKEVDDINSRMTIIRESGLMHSELVDALYKLYLETRVNPGNTKAKHAPTNSTKDMLDVTLEEKARSCEKFFVQSICCTPGWCDSQVE